jgi:23S rRNA (uracil1939-C5)-methyltransferase
MTANVVRVEGRIRDIVQSGEAVAETERGIVFVRGALKGERVAISLDPKVSKPLRGRVISVLEPAQARVEPPCPHVLRCGGCPLMHASLDEQRALKLGFLGAALRKVGAPESLEIKQTLANQVLGYRRRARLAFQVARGARKLGYRRERSHELADVDSCAVLHPALAVALTVLRERLLPELSGEGEISLALGQDGRAIAVARTADLQSPVLYSTCDAIVSSGALGGLALYAGGVSKPAQYGQISEWSEAFDGGLLEGAIAGFSQAHAEVNRALVERVRELASVPGLKVLELYAGHGNFTVALANGAASYTAVEQDSAAVAALRRNLGARQVTAKVVEGDALKYTIQAGLDLVLLDPPRGGAAGLLGRLAERKAKRIVYVSCDPQTLARDVAEILPKGYRITWAEAFEMFPQTADLETVLQLTRD